MSTREKVNVTVGVQRKSLEAIQIFACVHCRAPGVYTSELQIKDGWPKCYRADLASGTKIPVGKICPQCGMERVLDTKDHGEVSASMPLWVWYGVLAYKWVLIQIIRAYRGLKTAVSWSIGK